MDVVHCVIAVPSELAKFDTPQIERRYNVFLYVLSKDKPTVPSTVQRYTLFPIWQKRFYFTSQESISMRRAMAAGRP